MKDSVRSSNLKEQSCYGYCGSISVTIQISVHTDTVKNTENVD